MGLAAAVLTRLPLVGSIDGSVRAHPPTVNHPTLGRSSSRVPTVVRFKVDDKHRPPAGVGRLTKQTLFAELPPFTCNVAFACGPIHRNVGTYADPSSPWFNIFTGVYEVVAERTLWPHPFGYHHDRRPQPEHVIRLGVADWTYFSAHLYGVALADIDNRDPLHGVRCSTTPHPMPDPLTRWDLLEIEGVRIPDPAQAQRFWTRGQLPHVWRGVWQIALGLPPPDNGPTRPSVMRARVLMCTRSDARNHRTLVLGATADTNHPNAALTNSLLETQFHAIEQLARTRYNNYGHSPPVRHATRTTTQARQKRRRGSQ
jgi:hypothetical protein